MGTQNSESKKFDQGKTRMDLLPLSMEEVAKVMTYGAHKYGDHNWLSTGMKWSRLRAALGRHLNEFDRGVDFDAEAQEIGNVKLLHMAQVATNALMLCDYYKYHPDKDDRVHLYLFEKRTGLDVDEVVADFAAAYCNRFQISREALHWNFDYKIGERMEELREDKEFWLSIPPLVESIPFEPKCYITSRPVPAEWTEEWLEKHGFPCSPVISQRESKVETAKSMNLDMFVDDRWQHFIDLNKAGICTFLMDSPHNRKYQNVGFKRIYSLNDITR